MEYIRVGACTGLDAQLSLGGSHGGGAAPPPRRRRGLVRRAAPPPQRSEDRAPPFVGGGPAVASRRKVEDAKHGLRRRRGPPDRVDDLGRRAREAALPRRARVLEHCRHLARERGAALVLRERRLDDVAVGPQDGEVRVPDLLRDGLRELVRRLPVVHGLLERRALPPRHGRFHVLAEAAVPELEPRRRLGRRAFHGGGHALLHLHERFALRGVLALQRRPPRRPRGRLRRVARRRDARRRARRRRVVVGQDDDL
mmetsp:Transcript_27370/g.84422  ORF Transcript_27370/g.84422 Transcript_27370/m.84422 type:complete len:255 (+) Transcript_27370:157-921(+)